MTPLGFSKIALYLQCPRAFHDQYISKEWDFQADANSPHLVRGTEVHKSAELYVIDKLAGIEPQPVTNEAKNVLKILDRIIDSYSFVSPEQRVAIDINWKQIPINVFWQSLDGRETYMRAVFDLIAVEGDKALLADFKTGKHRKYAESEHSQLKLSAAILFEMFPEVQNVQCSYLYVDHKQTENAFYTRDQLEDMKKPFDKIAKEINETEHFDEKVNQNCRWCKSLTCPMRK